MRSMKTDTKKRPVKYPFAYTVNFTSEMKELVEEMANKEGRTVSQQIRWIVEKVLENN